MPCPTTQLATGTILVHEPAAGLPTRCALYSRVSSADQKSDADRQLQRLRDYAAANGLPVGKEVTEIGSGLNGHRKQLLRILSDPSITVVLVEHRDRLVRFGFDFLSATLEASGRAVRVINETECDDDLVRDVTEVLTSLCARLYGRRGAANRAKRALQAAESIE